MRRTYHQLYIHAVWATWDRLPLITPAIQAAVYADIRVECDRIKAELIEIGGVEDHIHVLIRIPPTLCVADLVKQVKGASSHLVTHKVARGEFFKWQGSYGALTVSSNQLNRVRTYIQNQRHHHESSRVVSEYERVDEFIDEHRSDR